jgi:hypothetical protein
MLDLTGDGVDELLAEADWGGAGMHVTELDVFELRRGHFANIVAVYTSYEDLDDGYTQKLDLARTLQSRGRQFCFIMSQHREKDKALKIPKISRPCYMPGDGIEAGWASERNEMLKPLHAPAP